MAYWRNYRKFSAEACAVAYAESSDEETINKTQNGVHEIITENFPDNIINGLLVSTYSSSEDETMPDYCESKNECPLDSVKTFGDELASWSTKYQVQRAAVNDLLELLQKQGHALPKDARTLLGTPKEVVVTSKCGGQYIYFGLARGISQVLSKHPLAISDDLPLQLTINIDGLPLFKSTSDQFWPILGSFNNHDVFLIGLFYGKHKPDSLEEYLEDFLEELHLLEHKGITHDLKTFRVKLLCISCDAPARSFLKVIVGHTGYFSCERCEIRGTWEGRVVFNSADISTLRTESAFAKCSYENHQKGRTPLINHGISCINGFALDYMHLVCLGVVKRILHFLKNGPRHCKLSSGQLSRISENLLTLRGKMPSEFARQPRSLTELERWKATEFRQFLLYTGPIVLKGVVSHKLYQHFLALSIAISIMLDSNADRRNSYLDYSRQLTQFFLRNCAAIYGETFAVYNVHGLLHLHEDVRNFQCSLNELSCFKFENFLQKLKKLVRSGQNPLVQVAKRLSEVNSSNPKSVHKKRFTVISTKLKDSCFLLESGNYAFVKEVRDDGRVVCNVLSQRETNNFYRIPAESKLFGISYVNDLTLATKRCLLETDELLSKVTCLPVDGGYLLTPLRHEVERC